MKNKLVLISVLLILAVSLTIGGIIFWSDIQVFLGLKKTVAVESYVGKPFVFNLGSSTITIPDKFPDEVLELLKKDFIEKGGMPLRLEEKGNGLPFGMP